MRGFYLKAAQLMSIREDYLPPQYLEWTTKMQSEAPVTFDFQNACKIMENEFGVPKIGDIFTDIQPEPIGSASIGQVYKARLRSSGDLVAMKIQSPNVEKQFRADLRSCKAFCRIALPHLVVPLEEIELQFLTEFDYSLEAKNLDEIRNNILPTWGHKVEIPRPYLDLCTRRVLVMQYIEGRKVSDIFSEYIDEIAKREKKGVIQIRTELKQKILQQGLSHTSWKRFGQLAERVASIVTFGMYRPTISVDVVDLLRTAMEVHGHQIFINRTFNGDPHPGNLLLTREGKLGLIDFGQVKRLSPERVEQFSRLVIALNDDDHSRICEIADEIGCKNIHNIPDVVWRLTAFWMDRDTPDVTMGLDIHKFLEEMEKRDPQKILCQDLVMVSRCSVMLRSLGLSLGLRVRTTDYWRKYAEKYLQEWDRPT
jgi:aarF domain-containing kinase